ncbi:MAG: response regulator transcription factor [Candidatus Eremiobacterota bacterium]
MELEGMRALVVEDTPEIATIVEEYLRAEGLDVRVAANGTDALGLLATFSPDVMVLDVRLPDVDGLTLCRKIRQNRSLPILILSARGEDIDKIVGLEMGADDYLAKPFNPREMVARVRALLRRSHLAATAVTAQELIVRKGLTIDLTSHRVEFEGREIPLTPLEFSLLRALAERPGQVFTRQQLLDTVWGAEFAANERTVDTHIRNLRAKLREAAPANFITAIRTLGYRFDL